MKLSIITVNRNNAAGLARTLESTLGGQSGFADWEQIVVDGASTDGSVTVLDKWKDSPRLGWHVSELDTGIYNAMNKGAAKAKGDYLLFLNSGDVLLDNALERLFSISLDGEIVVSNMIRFRNGVDEPFFKENPLPLTPAFFLVRSLPHQGTLISRSLHDKMGGYDESFRFAADLKFFFRCFTEGTPFATWISEPFSRFYADGASYQYKNFRTMHDEWVKIVAPYFGMDIATRAVFRLEERPWIREGVVARAKDDRKFAECLRYSTSAIDKLWRFVPTRLLLRFICLAITKTKRCLSVFHRKS